MTTGQGKYDIARHAYKAAPNVCHLQHESSSKSTYKSYLLLWKESNAILATLDHSYFKATIVFFPVK